MMEAPANCDILSTAPGDLRKTVLNLGYVELIDSMPRHIASNRIGVEAAIVDAARISYGEGTRHINSDRVLLRYLLRHRHTTPFEKVVFTWRIKAPIFVARQWMRHRAGSFNEESARYSKVRNEGYIPDITEVKSQQTGVLSSTQSGDERLEQTTAMTIVDEVSKSWDVAYSTYQSFLDRGVSRELARTVLPVGMYTTIVWKVDLWNLFHFLDLRMESHAQEQIRVYAKAIYDILQGIVPEALSAFNDYIYESITLTRLEVQAIRTAVTSGAPILTAELDHGKNTSNPRECAEWREKRARLFGDIQTSNSLS